jgi:hypothetical protein
MPLPSRGGADFTKMADFHIFYPPKIYLIIDGG